MASGAYESPPAEMEMYRDGPPDGSIGAMVATGGGCCKAPPVDWSTLTNQDKKAMARKLGEDVGDKTTGSCCSADPEALPNQPGCMNGMGICCHNGTKEYPAFQAMMDANAVSGVYQDPTCSCCTISISPVAAVGFLWTVHRCGPVCYACYPLPFNCFGPCTCSQAKRLNGKQCFGGLGRDGTPIQVFYCPTDKCLPNNFTLAATWFCCFGFCVDWNTPDIMLSSCGCCVPRVHRKIKQGKTFW